MQLLDLIGLCLLLLVLAALFHFTREPIVLRDEQDPRRPRRDRRYY